MVTWLRRTILAAALIAGLGPVMAQVPPPVPGLPDTERRTSYSISGTTCACSVGFQLYGDSTDFSNWVEVFLNGTQVQSTDPVFGWTITSPSGPLANLARPITDAVLTFNSAQTGTVQIVGARRPRRTSQFNENTGVPARNLNQVLTDIVAMLREDWDKINDVTGRVVRAPPGESMTTLPSAANRANKNVCFDNGGNLVPCSVTSAGTIAAGNGIGIAGSNPTTISENFAGAGPIVVTPGQPTTVGCPTCNTVPPPTSNNVVVSTRAAATGLNLSAFSVITTQGYTTPGDGGGATFRKTSNQVTDTYITGTSVSTVGSGCTNGSYNGVQLIYTTSGLGHGALASMTVSGGSVTSFSVTTYGNQYTAGDILTPDPAFSPFTCSGTNPQFTVGSVAAATCSFTDSAANKWQMVIDQGNFLNIKQCGAKVDYLRANGDPPGSTDDTVAFQNALQFAANILPPTIDAYGEAGTVLLVPRGISLVGALSIPQGVWLRGMGRYSSGLKMLNTLPNSSNWITVCDPNTQIACFGTRITDMTLWHNGTPSANAGTAMIFTNNLQQANAFERLQIPSGSRMCFNLQTGYGGASLIGFTDIECGTSTTTNPGMLINYPSALIPMHNVIVEANPPVAQSGISITGGYLDVQDFHCENYQNCIFMNVAANNGMSRFSQLTGGGTGCTNLLLRQSGSAASVNVVGFASGICTNKLNNAGTTTTTPIVADTVF